MARSRNIKPGFFKNEDLAELPTEVRLLFIGLWLLADREGRLDDRPKRISGELFPFDSFNIDSMLAELERSSFVVRYAVDGKRFIQIQNFVKHQDPHYRERASEIPPPPGVALPFKAKPVTQAQRSRIFERDGFKCRKCHVTDGLSIDHIVPSSKGGDSTDDNLQVLCLRCNSLKGAKVDEPSAKVEPRSSDGPGELAQGRPQSGPGVAPLIPDSLIPDSLQEIAASTLRVKPPLPPFDGKNLETLNGKAVVQIASQFELPETWGLDAEALGFKPREVLLEAERFRQYWTAGKGAGTRRSVKNWRQSWSTWLSKAAEKRR